MKRRIISIFTVAIAAGISFFQLANSGGPSIECTGSTFDSGANACTQCHGGNTLNGGTGNINITGISSYYPGSNYTLTMTVSQPNPTPVRYGFQTIGLTTGNAQAGDFTTGTGTKLQTIGGRQYIEQNFVFNSTGTWTFDWKAKTTTTGDVTFFFGGNAANGNGSTSGDQIYSGTLVVTQIPLITATTSAVDIDCFGNCTGSVSANGTTGGIPPYTYIWNDPSNQVTSTATGLCVGTYTVTITDSQGNSETETASVSEPTALVSITSFTGATCGTPDGSATVITTGGVSPFTYLWNDASSQTTPTANNLTPGTYMVTFTDQNGCTNSDMVTIPVISSGLTASLMSTEANCNQANGTATIVMNSGTTPFSYLWSNGDINSTAMNLAFGPISVTVTDANGCTDIFMTSVVNVGAPTVALTGMDADCHGTVTGSIQSAVTGGSMPYSYSWEDAMGSEVGTSDNLNGVGAGVYTLVMTDDLGCMVSEVFTITEPDSITLSGISDIVQQDSCNGELVVVATGGTPPYTFLWDDPNAQTDSIATGLCVGIYVATVTDANGCEKIIDTLNVEGMSTSVAEWASTAQVKIYPNPAAGELNISFGENTPKTQLLEVLNLMGQVVKKDLVPRGVNNHLLSLNDLSAGSYMLRIGSTSKVVRFVVK